MTRHLCLVSVPYIPQAISHSLLFESFSHQNVSRKTCQFLGLFQVGQCLWAHQDLGVSCVNWHTEKHALATADMAKNRLSIFELPIFGNHGTSCWQLNRHSPGVTKILYFEDKARLCGGRNIVHQRIWVLICSADFLPTDFWPPFPIIPISGLGNFLKNSSYVYSVAGIIIY